MRHFRTHSRLYSPLSAVTLAVFLAACTHWTPVPLEPAQLPAAGEVRAMLNTGQRVVITTPVISGDTIKSAVAEGSVRWSRLQPNPGIPLERIRMLEVRKIDGGATAGLIVLSAVALAAITLFAMLK